MAVKKKKRKKISELQPERTHMPIQDPAERIRNFDEVTFGYSEEDALREAGRCLVCPKAKCTEACPVSIDIATFIEQISAGDFRGAWLTITDANLMPAVCGRVCPQEDQCEGVCVIGKKLEPVAIGRLERYLGDMAIREGWTARPDIVPNGKRVGIVGSGPAGIACAADMAKAGISSELPQGPGAVGAAVASGSARECISGPGSGAARCSTVRCG